MPYKDPKDPRNIAYKKAYYQKTKHIRYEKYTKKANQKIKEKDPDRFSRYAKKYRTQDNEKLCKRSRSSYQKHIKKRLAAAKKRIDDLADSYVKSQLIKTDRFNKEELTTYPEIIEIHRIILKIKRYAKHQGA